MHGKQIDYERGQTRNVLHRAVKQDERKSIVRSRLSLTAPEHPEARMRGAPVSPEWIPNLPGYIGFSTPGVHRLGWNSNAVERVHKLHS